MLTAKQRECLRAIETYYDQHDRSPTYEELMPVLGLSSKSGVFRLIRGLEDRGYIRRIPHLARAIEVIKPQTHLSPEYQRGFKDGAEAERLRIEMEVASVADLSCARRGRPEPRGSLAALPAAGS